MRPDIVVIDPLERKLTLELAEDPQSGNPLWAAGTVDAIQPSFNIGQASFASISSKYGGVSVQPSLAGGMGKFWEELTTHPEADGYKHAERMDASQPGYIFQGPEVVPVTAPANSGPLESLFVLGGNPYLVLGQKIVSYAAGALAEVEDLGVGNEAFSAAAFYQDGAETADQASTATGAITRLDGPNVLLHQSFKPGSSRFQSKIDIQLSRIDVTAVEQISLTGVPTGGTLPLAYGGTSTAGIAFNADGPTMQAALRTIPDLAAVTVVKNGTAWVVTMTGIIGPALILVGDGTSLTGGTSPAVLVTMQRAGYTIASDVELAIQTDLNGKPSGLDVVVAAVPPKSIPAAAGIVTFRFDMDGSMMPVQGESYHMVLRAPGAIATAYTSWTKGAASSYANGSGGVSQDGGDSWTDGDYDFYFTTYTKAITETIYLGREQGDFLLSTQDGATYSPEAVEGKCLAVYGNRLVRDVRSSKTSGIQLSADGKNWGEAIVIGDAVVPVTAILPLAQTIIVVTEDKIWAVDPDAATVSPQDLHGAGRNSSNGIGSCVWNNVAYVRFGGRLVAVYGETSGGFALKRSVGPESQAEWHSPWGYSYIVAVAGDRHCLYAAMYTTSGYKLLKNYDPLKSPGRGWHGSIADLGSPAAFHSMAVYDAGGDASPLLFFSTDSYNVGKILLSRTVNPTADPAYRFDTVQDGELYISRNHGNFYTHKKAWLSESLTFTLEVGGGWAAVAFDPLDGTGYQELGRLFSTDTLFYKDGLETRLLDRKYRLHPASATTCPIILCSALTGAPRASVWLASFTVKADTGLSAGELGAFLGRSAQSISDQTRALSGSGTRRMIDPDGVEHRVLFTKVTEQLIELRTKDAGGNRKLIELEAVELC